MENLTPEQIRDAVIVILAVFAAVVALDKFFDVVKKWRQPEKDLSEKLRADKAALDRHESDITSIKDGQKVLCTAIVALLDHELHNGNTTQMENARSDLSKYLTGLINK